MIENQSSDYLKHIAKVSIDILKELAGKGVELSAETLFKALESNDEIRKLGQDAPNGPDASGQQPATIPPAQIEDLKSQLEKQRSQKDQLLKQIDILESQRIENDAFYKRGLLFVAKLLGTEKDMTVKTALAELQASLVEDTQQSRIVTAFNQFKDAALKEGIDTTGRAAHSTPKKASFLSKLFTHQDDVPPSPKAPIYEDALPQLVQAYQHIIDELKLSLGKQYLEGLLKIEKRLLKTSEIEELPSIRKAILSQIQQFIEHVGTERGLTLGFIKEISQRLMEVEKHVITSIDQTSRIHQNNQHFSLSLENHLVALQNSIDYSQTLTELKEVLFSRLNTINTVIAEKKIQDGSLKTDADRQLESLRHNMNQMKDQIQAAEKRASLLEQELLKDPLTGAYNRRAYDRRIIEELHRFLRYKTIFSLLLFDVDHFKRVNDTYGHTVGDKCLKEIISRITTLLRKCDFPARYGGEEFVLILPETNKEQGKTVGEKIRQQVEKIEFIHKGETIRITVSVGITQVTTEDKDPEAIFNRLDQAMYAAKNSGRNTVIVK